MTPEGPFAFRDHFASIFQSAVKEVGRRIREMPQRRTRGRGSIHSPNKDEYEIVAAELMAERLGVASPFEGPTTPASSTPSGRTRALSVSSTTRTCAILALRYIEARLSGDPERIARVQEEFKASACDPAWATTITEYLTYFGPDGRRREIPYVAASRLGERVIEIKSAARVALLADWGTGTPPASEVLKQIGELAPDILIHLGDVYYSGTPAEYRSNFLDPIEEILGHDRSAVPVYCLSGNYDMHCGGLGYYELIKELNPEPLTQVASYFCLRSADQKWQLLAMDTGLNDYSPVRVDDCVPHLKEEEIDWHLRRIEEFGGRTILMSHHPLFSAFSPIGRATGASSNPNLLQFLGEANMRGRIAAWFWGHEHSLGIYEPYAGLRRGRCIGHGAVPVQSSERIYLVLPDLQRPPRIIPGTELALEGNIYAHGFAVLVLGNNDEGARAAYFQNRGGRSEKLFEETID